MPPECRVFVHYNTIGVGLQHDTATSFWPFPGRPPPRAGPEVLYCEVWGLRGVGVAPLRQGMVSECICTLDSRLPSQVAEEMKTGR